MGTQLYFPDGLSTKQARRLADITDALTEGGFKVEALVDARLYEYVECCNECGWEIEGGRCYTCKPIWGYGENRTPIPRRKEL